MLRLCFVVASLFPVTAVVAWKAYNGYMVYELVPTERQTLLIDKLLNSSLYDFWTHSRVPGHPIRLMVAPRHLLLLKFFLEKHAITYNVLITDLQKNMELERARQSAAKMSIDSRFNYYQRYNQMQVYLATLATQYKDKVSLDSIGKSYEGRDISILKISTGGGGVRPVIFIDAGIHAREWIAPAMALYIINQLVEVDHNCDLIANVDWHIIPVLNVDGYEYTHTMDRLWTKTRSLTPVSDCKGVDMNRNYGFHWIKNDVFNSTCNEQYSGTRAFSEPETECHARSFPEIRNRIKLYLTLHGYDNYILYPWGYTDDLPSNWKAMHNLAKEANAALMAAGGKSYTIGTFNHLIHQSSGSSLDWVKGYVDAPFAFALKLPGGGSDGIDMPGSAIETTARQFFQMIRVFGLYVDQNH